MIGGTGTQLSNLLKRNLFKASTRNYALRRAYMYVPGDDEKKINKSLNIDVDCIVLDCEDGVAINRKANAREIIRSILDKGKKQKDREYDLGVRCNSIPSGLCKDDLQVLLTGKHLPDTVSLPKVENVDHVKWFADKVNSCIKDAVNRVNLIIFIESAISMVNLADIVQTGHNLSQKSKYNLAGLVFGSDDFCASIGATRTESSQEILYARQKLVLHAKAYKLQAIDMVYIQYKDLEGLKRQCIEGAKMGYTGKQVIHPGQVPVVQDAFLPNKKQVEWAEGLLRAFDDHQKSGKGAFNYQGSMIDMPTMKQAQNIMETIKLSNKKM